MISLFSSTTEGEYLSDVRLPQQSSEAVNSVYNLFVVRNAHTGTHWYYTVCSRWSAGGGMRTLLQVEVRLKVFCLLQVCQRQTQIRIFTLTASKLVNHNQTEAFTWPHMLWLQEEQNCAIYSSGLINLLSRTCWCMQSWSYMKMETSCGSIFFFFTSYVIDSTNILYLQNDSGKKTLGVESELSSVGVFHSCYTMILCLAGGFVNNNKGLFITSQDWIQLCRLQIKSEHFWYISGDESPSTVQCRDLQLSERAYCSHSVRCVILLCVCVCFWYLPWKLLLFVRKCRRYCGSPFLFTTQELMVRGGGTQQGIQLDDLWRRKELNCENWTFCRTN